MKKIIATLFAFDPQAFIVFSESQKIKGEGFYIYK